MNVKAVDENDQPINSAQVETSDGQKATTGPDGMAALKFGSLGAHTVTVAAEGRAPSVLTVTMPMDRGKTLTARLGQPVDLRSGVAGAGAVGGMAGMMSGMMAGQLYPMIFQSLFVAQGYNMELAAYEPGQWTEWRIQSGGEDKPVVMRKAFLTRLANGQEWWQIRLPGESDRDSLTLEVLFAAGRTSIRRMRQQTGDQQPQEVPVAEGWYSQPVALTPESLEGAVKERGVSVDVPAGAFQCDLVEFATMGGGTSLRLWRTRSAPGAVVRVAVVSPDGTLGWDSQLAAYGSDAKTALGSY